MPKSSFEKALEKQTKAIKQQEKKEKQRAQKQQLADTAVSVINGQTYIGGMRIMDEDSEECLKSLLSAFDGNSSHYVEFAFGIFPAYLQNNLKLHLEKLKQYGMISDYDLFVSISGEVYLTSTGLNYFDKKNKAIDNQSSEKKSIIRKEYDVFVSHANKDKLDYVDNLVDSIKRLGINIFYDKDEFVWGDNWKEKILVGTKQSEFAIIVISNNFFDREWTEKELNEFLHLQNESEQKIILPLLYGITYEDVSKRYPELEYIQGIEADKYDVEEITILLAKVLIKRYKEVK